MSRWEGTEDAPVSWRMSEAHTSDHVHVRGEADSVDLRSTSPPRPKRRAWAGPEGPGPGGCRRGPEGPRLQHTSRKDELTPPSCFQGGSFGGERGGRSPNRPNRSTVRIGAGRGLVKVLSGNRPDAARHHPSSRRGEPVRRWRWTRRNRGPMLGFDRWQRITRSGGNTLSEGPLALQEADGFSDPAARGGTRRERNSP